MKFLVYDFLPEINSLKFHNNDVSSTWTKHFEQKKQPPPSPTLRFSSKKVLLKYSVNGIHRHCIFLCSYPVKSTKIPEDLEDINVEENKHES